MTIYEKLSAIQAELNAPKNQYNSYGGFYYRNCEDILNALKPLCKAQKTVLVIADNLLQIGDRYYVESVATLHDLESKDHIEVTAYAREEETKKGMDGSQVTGASSSYARKYALNGLFCIDDAKDSDYTNGIQNAPKAAPQAQKQPESVNTRSEQKTPQNGAKCQECGTWISDKVNDYSMKKFNAPLCMDCQKKHGNK